VKHGARVIYLLRQDENRPPETLIRAAGGVHLLRAGSTPDGPARDFGAHLLCIHAPYDYDARNALEQMAALELPALVFGEIPADASVAHVSENVSITDLRTVLDLMFHIATLHEMSATECRAEDGGECRGRIVEEMITLLEHLLNLRIPDHAERAGRVFEASLWIGNHLCLPPHELKDLSRAARLREIGKLALPDRLLFSHRHERTPTEQQAYDHYPVMGARVLRELPPLRNVAVIVEYQLENFDGSGPVGLMAHQIPLGSRILRVASAFAMMLNSEGRTHTARDVVAILDSGRGSLYDPLLVKLVENFLHVTKAEGPKKQTQRVRISDLQEDMVLAEDVWSRTGMKIIPAGTRITPHLLRILAQFPLDPTLEAVQIIS
jgi:HD-GYP domain-containing protein (c-di-GMP phosphodiesterase class II)